MKKRVIAILRVSTDAQDVARQRADIARLVRAHDLEVIRTLELVGVSGTATLDNAQVQRVLADLAQPGVDGIGLSSLDRLFRPGKRYGQWAILDHFTDARKAIWCQREGFIDPTTDEGYDKCMSAGGRAGQEWRQLKQRTWDGKEVLRREKRHVNGATSLPRGVAYDKAADRWSYQEPDCSRVQRMCELLLAGDSFHTVAAKVGGGWTYQGVRKTLRNPIWAFGTRVYEANERREEGYQVKVIDQPLIPVTTWEAVQRELDRRKQSWRKTKQPPRFLLSSLLKCGCGKSWYIRCSSGDKSRNYYYCSTQFRGRGPSCGAPSLQQKAADAFIAKMAGECFTDLAVLAEMLREVVQPPAPVGDTAKDVARLEARRERILEQRADGLITREKCNQQVAAIDRELQAARATVTVPAPAIDVKRLAAALVRVFAGFHRKPFEFQRDLLREAVREIVVDNGTIPGFTFRGGFLGGILESANSSPRLTASSQISTLPDLTITLPEPWMVPSIDRRRRDATSGL